LVADFLPFTLHFHSLADPSSQIGLFMIAVLIAWKVHSILPKSVNQHRDHRNPSVLAFKPLSTDYRNGMHLFFLAEFAYQSVVGTLVGSASTSGFSQTLTLIIIELFFFFSLRFIRPYRSSFDGRFWTSISFSRLICNVLLFFTANPSKFDIPTTISGTISDVVTGIQLLICVVFIIFIIFSFIRERRRARQLEQEIRTHSQINVGQSSVTASGRPTPLQLSPPMRGTSTQAASLQMRKTTPTTTKTTASTTAMLPGPVSSSGDEVKMRNMRVVTR
jgi:hypothetical protein